MTFTQDSPRRGSGPAEQRSNLRAVHVIPSISQEASGPTYSVVRLCRELSERNFLVTLATIGGAEAPAPYGFVKAFQPSPGPLRLGFSRAMRLWLAREVRSGRLDLIHNHSFWMMPNLYAGWAARTKNTRLVVSPRGTLAEEALAISRGPKRLFWPLLQKPAIARAVCFHATAESELADIRRMGFRQPVAVIPNGIELPPPVQKPRSRIRTLLFLGRIHPIKGLDSLLKAWAAVATRHADWRLVIAGPSERGHREHLESLAERLACPRVLFEGPMYGEDKWAAYRAAALFVLPSRSENFGMTVAEALAAGTPCITTEGTPWRDIAKQGAGWWIPARVDALAECLDDALALPAQTLEGMGEQGRKWMNRDYAWDGIGFRMAETYCWLKYGGITPPWIHTD